MSQINVNTITGKDGGSAVNFPHGITVTGVVTATTLNQNVVGVVTATTFDGNVTGNLTGNVTGNTSGTAGGLTGTPNITVGTVTGTDATFSGNLTVNGTTTTIDTAVTAVDSLVVDGSVGIGTTNPVRNLHLATSGNNNAYIHLTHDGTGHTDADGADIRLNRSTDTLDIMNLENQAITFHTNGENERLRIDGNGTTKFKGPLTEKCHYDTGGGLTGDYNHDLITHGNVYWSDTAAAGAWTFNLRGSATVALNDMMDTGESLSFWLAHACNSNTAYYMTAFKVDGTTISGTDILWSGGSAPTSAGGGSGTKDVYAFTVFKTANATFRAFASVTNHG